MDLLTSRKRTDLTGTEYDLKVGVEVGSGLLSLRIW